MRVVSAALLARELTMMYFCDRAVSVVSADATMSCATLIAPSLSGVGFSPCSLLNLVVIPLRQDDTCRHRRTVTCGRDYFIAVGAHLESR